MIVNGYEIKPYANLRDAYLSDANLCGANLCGANLCGANLRGADLRDADLCGANLCDADLRDAYLRGAYLSYANLRNANLRNANLRNANLRDANLSGATMPDGRKFEDYVKDPLAGICDSDNSRLQAIKAWNRHSWKDCPMHAAHGWNRLSDCPKNQAIAVAAFIAAFDGRLLPCPKQ
jgi:hypothetical protein